MSAAWVRHWAQGVDVSVAPVQRERPSHTDVSVVVAVIPSQRLRPLHTQPNSREGTKCRK